MRTFTKTVCFLGLGILATLGSMGCFSHMVWTQSENPPAYLDHTLLEDSILAIGQPDEASRKAVDNPHAMLFLGEKHSYFLEAGGAELERIARELDGNLIRISEQSHMMFMKDDKFWGEIPLFCTRNHFEDYSQEEIVHLTALGFKRHADYQGTYELRVKVKGVLCPRVEIPEAQLRTFKRRREISFYAPPKSAAIPVIKRIFLMPVAVAADVVTSPVQLLGLGALVILLSNTRVF